MATGYPFTKSVVNIQQLGCEIFIKDQDIGMNIAYINWSGSDELEIFFNDALTSPQETTVGTVVSAHTACEQGDKNFFKVVYNDDDEADTETWYHTDNGDGTYSKKVEETTYTYSETDPHKIEEYTKKYYFMNGVEILCKTATYEYFTDELGNLIIKLKE